MNKHFPDLPTLSLSDAQAILGDFAAAVARDGARVVLTQDGAPVAALVSPQDLERVLAVQRRWLALLEAQREMAAGFADVSAEDAEVEIDRIFQEMRAADHVASKFAAAG